MAVLAALASRPGDAWIDCALEATLQLSNTKFFEEAAQVAALETLAPHLGPVRLNRAVAAALRTTKLTGRVREVVAVLTHLDSAQRSDAVAQCLDRIEASNNATLIAEGLTALSPYLEKDDLGRAVTMALSLGNTENRVSVLVALAPRLDGESLGQVLESAYAIEEVGPREKLLLALVPRLSDVDLAKLLDFVLALKDERERGVLFERMTPLLTPPLLARALEAALRFRTSDFFFDDYRTWALAALASRLDRSLLSHAFESLNAIDDQRDWAATLASLAPNLPDAQPLLPLIFSGVDPWSHPSVLKLLLPADRATFLERANAIDNPVQRATALVAMSQAIDEPDRQQFLARVMEGLADGELREVAVVLADMIPLLSESQRPMALLRAAQIADNLADEDRFADDEAWDESARWDRVLRLTTISAHLDTPRQARALKQALSRLETPFGSWPLIEPIIPFVENALLDGLLEGVLAVRSEHSRARLLAALAPRLSSAALSLMLESTLTMRDERARATALAGLAPRLAGADLTRALEAALAIGEARDRVQALTGFVSAAPDPSALRADICRTLARCFAPDRPSEIRRSLLWFLADRTVFAPPVLSPDTLAGISAHVIDVCTKWQFQ